MKTDLEIAHEIQGLPISEIGRKLGFDVRDLELYGSDKAKLTWYAIKRYRHMTPLGKLILVTSISPTPAGEGKSTMTIGLGDAINNQLHKKAMIALREPSMGPVFGLKGGATGGGMSQVIPMEDINLHFTGDMHALTSAIDTLYALVDNYLYQANDLDLDESTVTLKRALDVNDRTLRQITEGMGSKFNGLERKSGFTITAANELMAILCLAKDIDDLKKRIGDMFVGFTKAKNPVYIRDLGFQGAIATILADALKPNLVQTLEQTPAFIHGGPFANIAHGTNSTMATNLALHLADYVVTEAGFGADLGGEKFMDFVAPQLDQKPAVTVIVATVRALKYQVIKHTDRLDNENLDALKEGFANLKRHIANMKKFGVPVTVVINKFATDTQAELDLLKKLIEEQDVTANVVTFHEDGSKGGIEAAKEVVRLADSNKADLQAIYENDDDIKTKVSMISTRIYGAKDVEYTDKANEQISQITKLGYDKLPVIIAKTQASFTDDKSILGAPIDFTMHVTDVTVRSGAGFVVVKMGKMLLMPGLPKEPAALGVDVDNDGKITGLF